MSSPLSSYVGMVFARIYLEQSHAGKSLNFFCIKPRDHIESSYFLGIMRFPVGEAKPGDFRGALHTLLRPSLSSSRVSKAEGKLHSDMQNLFKASNRQTSNTDQRVIAGEYNSHPAQLSLERLGEALSMSITTTNPEDLTSAYKAGVWMEHPKGFLCLSRTNGDRLKVLKQIAKRAARSIPSKRSIAKGKFGGILGTQQWGFFIWEDMQPAYISQQAAEHMGKRPTQEIVAAFAMPQIGFYQE